MALLNQLLSEQDLAKLTNDQREFLVQRIDHEFDSNLAIHKIIASKLEHSLSFVAPSVKLAKATTA